MSVDWDVRPAWAATAEDEPAPPRRRRRLLVGAVVLVVLLAAAVVVGEWWGRTESSSQVATGLAEAGVTGDVRVAVGRGVRPSVVTAALLGDLDRVLVEVRDGQLGGLPVVRARYELSDLDVEVGLRSGSVRVTRVGSGSVRLELDPVIVGASVGVDLRAVDGELRLGSPGTTARARMDGDDLVIEPVGIGVVSTIEPLTVPAGDPYLLPCRPRPRVVGELLELACRGDTLPGVLRGPLGSTNPAGGGGGGSGGDVPVAELPTPQTTVREGG